MDDNYNPKLGNYVYMDNAATTRVSKEVFDSMQPYFCEFYENPSTNYQGGHMCQNEIAVARKVIANNINAEPNEIYFTSGGSESDNWALRGIAEKYSDKGKHIITTKIEHHAILNTCKFLENHGFEITYLNVDDHGLIDLEELENSIRPDTILISVMMVNNEIGTIEPVEKIGEIAHKHKVLFHTDAVQALGKLNINVKRMNIDLLSASAHKIHGAKGTGMLYVRNGVKIAPLIYGGKQEKNLRAGTENVAGIVGFGTAVKLAYENMFKWTQLESFLKSRMLFNLTAEIDNMYVNGFYDGNKVANILNISIDGVDSEALMLLLDADGIAVSSGSACTTGSLEPSHVLTAIGLTPELTKSSIRISLSHENTKGEVDYVSDKIVRIVSKLRSLR